MACEHRWVALAIRELIHFDAPVTLIGAMNASTFAAQECQTSVKIGVSWTVDA